VFIFTTEISARILQWEETDKVELTLLNVTVSAKTFYKGCSELHADSLTRPKFKTVFRNRYKADHTYQYHCTKLQIARQTKGEETQAFAHGCRKLARKIICKVEDVVAQRIHNENSERMLLASFVTGLTGKPDTHCRYSNPQSKDQSRKIAMSVHEAEGKEKISESYMQTLIGRLG